MDLEILEIASNTENNKVVINHTHSSRHKNAICGDEMKVYIQGDPNLSPPPSRAEMRYAYCKLSIFKYHLFIYYLEIFIKFLQN